MIIIIIQNSIILEYLEYDSSAINENVQFRYIVHTILITEMLIEVQTVVQTIKY